jgi:single-stranded-DNA-specific exonuclease
MAEKFSVIENGNPIDVVFTIDENEWNGITSLQLKVCDFRLSETSADFYST